MAAKAFNRYLAQFLFVLLRVVVAGLWLAVGRSSVRLSRALGPVLLLFLLLLLLIVGDTVQEGATDCLFIGCILRGG